MDFDQLETFLEVARHASFSRAAEKRFRTQPAISSQIRALEEEVGAKLFDRSGGKVALTAAGKVFLRYAEETLQARRVVMTTVGVRPSSAVSSWRAVSSVSDSPDTTIRSGRFWYRCFCSAPSGA